MNVRLNKEQKTKILNAQDVYNIMQQVLLRENKIRRNQEHFWIIGLDNSNKLLFVELLCLGADNRVHIDPPEVFRMAIYKMAKKAILVHNHPSGIVLPSEEDLDLTDLMIKSGQLLKIEIIDHLIISEKNYVSLKEIGAIEKLLQKGTYQLVKKHENELKELKLKSERNKGEFEAKIKIAKEMLLLNIPIETIKLATKLSLKQLNDLSKKK